MHNEVSPSLRSGELIAYCPGSKPGMVSMTLGTMMGHASLQKQTLPHEIGTPGEAVAAARRDVAAPGIIKTTAEYIAGATDELDAFVSHTASLHLCDLANVLASLD